MIAVIQRVKRASVSVNGITVGEIGNGLAILLGVAKGDEKRDAELLAAKIAKHRIFCDEEYKMNLSLKDVSGEALVISQFTLLANYSHGNRPDFFNAASPGEANDLYEYFCTLLGKEIEKGVEKGVFGAHMVCEFVNDGPVTIVMDSNSLKK